MLCCVFLKKKKKVQKKCSGFSEKSVWKEEPFRTLLYNENVETYNKCCPNEVQKSCSASYRASACRPLRSITEKLPLWVLQCEGGGDYLVGAIQWGETALFSPLYAIRWGLAPVHVCPCQRQILSLECRGDEGDSLWWVFSFNWIAPAVGVFLILSLFMYCALLAEENLTRFFSLSPNEDE